MKWLRRWFPALAQRYIPHGYVLILTAWTFTALIDWRLLTGSDVSQDATPVFIASIVTLFVLCFTIGILLSVPPKDL